MRAGALMSVVNKCRRRMAAVRSVLSNVAPQRIGFDRGRDVLSRHGRHSTATSMATMAAPDDLGSVKARARGTAADITAPVADARTFRCSRSSACSPSSPCWWRADAGHAGLAHRGAARSLCAGGCTLLKTTGPPHSRRTFVTTDINASAHDPLRRDRPRAAHRKLCGVEVLAGSLRSRGRRSASASCREMSVAIIRLIRRGVVRKSASNWLTGGTELLRATRQDTWSAASRSRRGRAGGGRRFARGDRQLDRNVGSRSGARSSSTSHWSNEPAHYGALPRGTSSRSAMRGRERSYRCRSPSVPTRLGQTGAASQWCRARS